MKFALTVLVSVTALLTACSSTPIDNTATSPQASATTVAPLDVTPKSAPTGQTVPAYLDPSSPIYQKRSIYFDFDVFTIKPQFNSVVEQHAAYLKAHPELQVRLEGNADERGGREYNLSLGQKRSESVKRALTTLGAGAGQQEAVSFGEEKPKAAGHDEASWAENRRVDIVYSPKK
jgi:peptidoglycan-associated lipoprotein